MLNLIENITIINKMIAVKNLYIVIPLLMLLNSCEFFQSDTKTETFDPSSIIFSDDKYQGNNIDDFQFVGSLEEELYLPPPCAHENNAVVQKFKIKKLIQGNYKEKFILIIEVCPELKGENFFKSDKEYIITANVNKKNPLKWKVYNYYHASGIPIFWSQETKLQLINDND